MEKLHSIICVSIENLKKLKHHTFQKRALVLSIICSKYKNDGENILKEEESIETLKIFGLIKKYIITLKRWLKKT